MFYLTKKFAHLFPKQHLTIFFLLFYDILNNDCLVLWSIIFYIPDTSETIAEVPDTTVPNTSTAEKFDIIDQDIDGNVHVET